MPASRPRWTRLHWMRGRVEETADGGRTLEWIGCNDAGAPIARVVRVQGPLFSGWRCYRAVALDSDGRIVELRPPPPVGAGWLACVGGQVVGRAAQPLAAVRTAEAALTQG
jgi:hypothetical protein